MKELRPSHDEARRAPRAGGRRQLVLFALGVLFGGGLVLGGMAVPANILAFLDFTGRLGPWDPRLVFMMGGAVVVYAVGQRLIVGGPGPRFGGAYPGPPSQRWREPRLWLGATVFGVGWGLAGYCPGPAWVAAASGAFPPVLVLLGTLAGVALVGARERARKEGDARRR